MYEFCYYTLEPYWQKKVHLHYIDSDSFVLSFDTNQENLIEFLQKNKDEFDFSELDENHELYNSYNNTFCCWIVSLPYDQSHILLVIMVYKMQNKKEYNVHQNTQTT